MAGRAAGLTERFMGEGAVITMVSGVLAAKAMVENKDYESLIKPLKNHLENLSALRKPFETLDNKGIDRLLAAVNIPGVKQLVYKSGINFAELLGSALKNVYKG